MYKTRLFKLLLSLPVFALSGAISIRSGIGVSAWDTFALGISNSFPIQYGTVTMITGLVILLIVLILKQPVGLGTILDTLVIGKLVDFFLWLDFIPTFDFLPAQICMLLVSLFICSIGCCLYTSAGLSVGPRDTMMIAISQKVKNVPIGFIKGAIEAIVFVIGVLLGGPIGIGTLISVFGIGFILQFTLNLFKIDMRNVYQENIIETYTNLKNIYLKSKTSSH